MAALECDASSCVYNYNQKCGANKIKVQGKGTMDGDNTFCGTFENKSLGNYISGLANANYLGALNQMTGNGGSLQPEVYCSAQNCTYNNQKVCTAPNVHILGFNSNVSETTECETFYPR